MQDGVKRVNARQDAGAPQARCLRSTQAYRSGFSTRYNPFRSLQRLMTER